MLGGNQTPILSILAMDGGAVPKIHISISHFCRGVFLMRFRWRGMRKCAVLGLYVYMGAQISFHGHAYNFISQTTMKHSACLSVWFVLCEDGSDLMGTSEAHHPSSGSSASRLYRRITLPMVLVWMQRTGKQLRFVHNFYGQEL